MLDAGTLRRLSAIGLSLVVAAGNGSSGQATALTDDERFVAALAEGAEGEPVDRARLAWMFVRQVTGMEREVGRLEATLADVESLPVPSGADPRLPRTRFEAYRRNLAALRQHVDGLAAEPSSRLLFYRVFMAGQRTCWTQDLFTRLVELRGADVEQQESMLPARESCAAFRTLVFQPRVEAILQDALIEQVYQRHEIGQLKQELRDLEQLVDDLMEIDSK